MLLAGQVAVVTGAGRGIGRAIARRFAGEGASVLVTSRTAAQAESVAKEIQAQGGKAAYLAADVGRDDFLRARKQVGRDQIEGAQSIPGAQASEYRRCPDCKPPATPYFHASPPR